MASSKTKKEYIEEEEMIEETNKKVTFRTLVKNMRIWIKPDYFEMSGPVRIPVKGEYIDFGTDGIYTTDKPEIIKFLRSHPWYNVTGRFYELKEE